MANDSGYCEHICNFSSVSIKALGNGKIFPVKVRNHSGIFLTSASAQDLRTLDMEKENRDAIEECSPRGVLEDSMRSSEAETSSSKTSTSYSEAPASPCVTSHWRGFLRLWKQKSMRRLYSFPPLGASKSSRKKNGSSNENKDTKSLFDEVGLCCLKPSWKNFGIAELRGATDNFSPENLIGKGGYAEVFKGCLPDGKLVAIKRLTRGTPEERVGDFLLELGIIVHVNHPNAAKFIGYGIEGGMHIVLQLSPHGSLASVLHGGSKEKLNWSIRYKIALGTAEGLRYLHEGCQRRIIHRDIKAANILLTEDFEPQISDFGLAKWLPDQWTHHTVSQFEGTFGYLAPEYFMHGIVDEKTDVFAYGVLLLELITGRKALDSSQQSLVMWAKPLLEENDVRELIDPSLADVYDSQQVNRLLFTASSCVQQSSILRPRMSQVAELLKGDRSFESAKSIQKTLQRTYSEEMLDSAEYNSTRYLSDLSRHRELALEF